MGVRCKIFNVGVYRRRLLGAQTANFFDPDHENNMERREEVVDAVMEDLVRYLRHDGGQVAIFDATSATPKRRARVRDKLLGGADPVLQPGRLIFLEITCGQQEVRDQLIREAGLTMPEYQDKERFPTPEHAEADLRDRIRLYEKSYAHVSPEEDLPFIWCDPAAERMRMYRIKGYLPGRLAFLLMNLRVRRRNVFICETAALSEPSSPPTATAAPPDVPAHLDPSLSRKTSQAAMDESAALRQTLASRSQPLSEEGTRFSRGLVGLLRDRLPEGEEVTVWTSSDDAGRSTASNLAQAGFNTVSWRYLGLFGFSVSQKMMGETYEDVTERLEPIIFEIERSPTHLLIIASSRVAQLLSAYLGERTTPEQLEPHTVVRILPSAFGIESELYTMHTPGDIPASTAFEAAPLWTGGMSPAGGCPSSYPGTDGQSFET